MSEPQHDAFLVITDISGYTGFLKQHAEDIRHGQYVVSELMGAIVGAALPPLRPAKLEGDAVFFHGAEEAGAAQAVGRSLMAFFEAFDARRSALIGRNSCPCSACCNIDRLELKAVAHRGKVMAYRLAGFSELAGFDIIVAHRLLKNGIDGNRYLFVTDPAWEGLGLVDATAHTEHYDDVGAISGRLLRPSRPGGGAGGGAKSPGRLAKAAEMLRKGWRSLLLSKGWRRRAGPTAP